jgi:hypothetical protein
MRPGDLVKLFDLLDRDVPPEVGLLLDVVEDDDEFEDQTVYVVLLSDGTVEGRLEWEVDLIE